MSSGREHGDGSIAGPLAGDKARGRALALHDIVREHDRSVEREDRTDVKIAIAERPSENPGWSRRAGSNHPIGDIFDIPIPRQSVPMVPARPFASRDPVPPVALFGAPMMGNQPIGGPNLSTPGRFPRNPPYEAVMPPHYAQALQLLPTVPPGTFQAPTGFVQVAPLMPTNPTGSKVPGGALPQVFQSPLPGQEFDHRLRRGLDRRKAPSQKETPYPVEELLDNDDLSGYLDARRFAAIPVQRSFFEVSGRNPKRTRREAWHARWRHLPGITGEPSEATVGSCNMPFLRCPEEYEYQGRMRDFVCRILADSNVLDPNGNPLGLVMLQPPYDTLYFLDRRKWGDNAATEARFRAGIGRLMFGWHNVELFDIAPPEREHF